MHEDRRTQLLPSWVDGALKIGGVLLVPGLIYAVALAYYGTSPQTMDIGYEPPQPVPYSHALHAGELEIDCRYCHDTVERAAHAAIPPTETCMNCHSTIRTESEKLAVVRESHATGMPIEWLRVHDLPDFVYFDHSAHVRRGVGCEECHGPVDQMETVYQYAPLSMSWCLKCHRDPTERLRSPELATTMSWDPGEDRAALGAALARENNIHPSTDCSTCHR
ncbi:MAG: cytochrome c3 family protein [Gemmatimonadota bacterium]|nr:cytochrome C [Gemmatimonadota bacterium]MDP6462074.1 cytochrome c3 family protein [Gemmatimonadota bacterium]MDP6529368.1 cytochrome c3 family protein [Gemmatimonadota bacterium]MDP6803345.1 cytochrome c3 family protein [Gemmatimonadota bacterium]MDP7031473.1 cytochrome c3 family protein [Gemmatimonadota bacterium]